MILPPWPQPKRVTTLWPRFRRSQSFGVRVFPVHVAPRPVPNLGEIYVRPTRRIWLNRLHSRAASTNGGLVYTEWDL